MGSYARPTRVPEALRIMAAGAPIVVAGGTDYFPARVGKPADDDILDITALDGLRGIADRGDHLHIGALTTWTDVVAADLPEWLDGLCQAAKEIGGLQIQNAGTVVGNLCNASPAADGIPNLLACDALVELASVDGVRHLRVGDFVLGNRRTARGSGELVTGLLLPKPRDPARACFLKLGARRYLVISIAMVAAVAEVAGGRLTALRVAVGSCSAVARRLEGLEEALVGQPAAPALAGRVEAHHLAGLAPVDDVRGTAAYRRDAALVLVRRALATVLR